MWKWNSQKYTNFVPLWLLIWQQYAALELQRTSILTCKFRILQCEEWIWKLCTFHCELHLCCYTSTVCSSTTTTTAVVAVVKGKPSTAATYACKIKKIQLNQHLDGRVEFIVRTLRVHLILYGVQDVIMKCNLHVHILLTTNFDKNANRLDIGLQSWPRMTPMAPLTVEVLTWFIKWAMY